MENLTSKQKEFFENLKEHFTSNALSSYEKMKETFGFKSKNSIKQYIETLKKQDLIIEKDNNDTGLLIKTIEPKVRGVAIVCEGGNKTMVQNQIYSAISAVLNISTSRISISKLTYMEE